MLILTRKAGQGIIFQPNTVVRVLSVEGDRVKLGVTAPANIVVLREELCDAVGDENRMAAGARGAPVRESLRRTLRALPPAVEPRLDAAPPARDAKNDETTPNPGTPNRK